MVKTWWMAIACSLGCAMSACASRPLASDVVTPAMFIQTPPERLQAFIPEGGSPEDFLALPVGFGGSCWLWHRSLRRDSLLVELETENNATRYQVVTFHKSVRMGVVMTFALHGRDSNKEILGMAGWKEICNADEPAIVKTAKL